MNIGKTMKDIEAAKRAKKKSRENKINWILIAKTAALILLLLAAAWFFGVVCERIQNGYLNILLVGKDIIDLGINVVIASTLFCMALEIAATLIRPFWVMLISLVLTAPAIMAGWEFSQNTAIVTLLFAAIAIFHAYSVKHKLNNQIAFSLHPLFDAQKLLIMGLTGVICASFALGYFADATKNNFAIPPQAKETISKYLIDTTRQTIEKDSKLKKDQVTDAVTKSQQQYDKMLTDIETQIKPQIQNVAIFMGIMLFFILYTAMILLGLLILFVLEIIFPILKITRFTKLQTEMAEIKKLTL